MSKVRHNFIVNVLDGGFFGMALGFSSYVTVIPLFFSTLTDSTILIGLLATIHTMGWQLPQLLTANRVSQLRRYRWMVLLMTLNERIPFIFLVFLTLSIGRLDTGLVLLLAYGIIVWQSVGGGLTATAWQSMITKIIPSKQRGTFYGTQSSLANLLSSFGALSAGYILITLPYPMNFALCFGLSAMIIFFSWFFLGLTQEEPHQPQPLPTATWRETLYRLWQLLAQDKNFGWFVGARALMAFATMAAAFYTVYAVRVFKVDAQMAGFFTGAMLFTQFIFSPLAGYIGDRFGHRYMLIIGGMAMAASAFLAMVALNPMWFFPVFILNGIVNSTQWTSILAMTSEFGSEETRPYYVGLSNTLISPATLIAPIIGGFLADVIGYSAMFVVAIASGLLAAVVLVYWVQDPRSRAVVPQLALSPSSD